VQNLDTLRRHVEVLYAANNPKADPWIDWSYKNHVLVVAAHTQKLATAHEANIELAVAGALLHDIADTITTRKDPEHKAKSLELAREILQKSGFSDDETTFVITEIIMPHSCKESLPTVIEGKVMATADGAAHFSTDFYPVFCWRHYGPQDDYQVFKSWMLAKMEKDITRKFFFDEAKQEIFPRYEALKLIFS